MAMSADGSRLAVSNALGDGVVNGKPGHVRVYEMQGSGTEKILFKLHQMCYQSLRIFISRSRRAEVGVARRGGVLHAVD